MYNTNITILFFHALIFVTIEKHFYMSDLYFTLVLKDNPGRFFIIPYGNKSK